MTKNNFQSKSVQCWYCRIYAKCVCFRHIVRVLQPQAQAVRDRGARGDVPQATSVPAQRNKFTHLKALAEIGNNQKFKSTKLNTSLLKTFYTSYIGIGGVWGVIPPKASGKNHSPWKKRLEKRIKTEFSRPLLGHFG